MINRKNISNTPEGVLVVLKDKICVALGLDVYNLKRLIDLFVTTVLSDTANKTHFAKVNIFNEFSKNKMTVKVFFKFLRVIRIKNIRITITATTHQDKQVVVHEDINILNNDE